MSKPISTDARKLTAAALTDLRIRGVKAVQSGQHPDQVARALGVSRAAVYNWLALYRTGGWHALNASSRGGRKPKLGPKELQLLAATILNDDPRQHKFAFALWTLQAIMEVIRKKFGVVLSRFAVSKLLKQLGMSQQRPLWRAWQQDPKKVEAWLEDEYPKIKRRAKRLGAEIFFGDEAGIRSDGHAGTTWGLRGLTPVIQTTGARFGINVISAISSRGHLRFMIVEGNVNACTFVDFLKRLIAGMKHPVFLVVDGHPAHRARKVREFVASSEGMLELYTLPAYSPELNPDELVWNNLKNHSVGKVTAQSKSDLRRIATSALRSLQKRPETIQGFFKHPETCYAA
jgi:transposase